MMHDDIRALIEALPLPVLLVDRNERFELANALALALLGPDLEGRPLVTRLRQPALGLALEAALAGERPEPASVRITARDREISALVHVSPYEGRALMAIEDISALEDAGAMRRDFVANVSHELRTPLTALIGFIETLQASAKDDPVARERFLGIMEREAKRMTRLVADLLSLSRVEAEERRRPAAEVDISAVIAGAFQSLAPAAEAAQVELKRLGVPGPLRVKGDADQLTQVFSNLIENAIKYGGSGGEVSVAIEEVAHEPVLRGPALRITVADKGEGIDPIHLPRLTERFYRVDTHRSREKGGTGLGLAIVKHIINRHRGRMKIESEKGQGSRFTVILPRG
ncbi:ATP-binding protein [Pseudothioclava arenosa]|uniref:histidine kinase n=1 Tax=Pseudothioclava arenosa TaxID=1795308 RepID=A0A2A4CS29_9RHOB|nr:ATP-binding protein [Pseudothioclava arenosa]PCD76904.1 two-component sensor histidine kinase [Pseudothioclava arenosa]